MEYLTNNLKEKEDNINHLNEMIDSYEKIISEQDNIIEIKNQRIKLLENILIKHNVSFPKDNQFQTNLYNKINEAKDNNEINSNKMNENFKLIEEKQIKDVDKNDNFNGEFLNLDNKKNETKVKIRFSNSESCNNKNEIDNKITTDEIKDKLNGQNLKNGKDIENNESYNIINNSELSNEFKKNYEIINNSSIKNNNISNEISLENFDKNKDFDDEENFNVFISGTLKPKNNKPKEIINNKEIKSSKNLESIISNKNSDNILSKISKNSDNNLFSIESKDKIAFIVNNIEKKKNGIQIIKTPNISPKSRSKSKLQNNKLNKYNSNFKKKK
jgi:hypothetical protein